MSSSTSDSLSWTKDVDVVIEEDDDVVMIHHQQHGFLEREAMRMSRRPKTYFWIAFLICLALSGAGFYYGGFSVTIDARGWTARGSLIANRQVQLELVRSNRHDLVTGEPEVWDQLTSSEQVWFRDYRRRRLQHQSNNSTSPSSLIHNDLLQQEVALLQQQEDVDFDSPLLLQQQQQLSISPEFGQLLSRRLQEDSNNNGLNVLETCDVNVYFDEEFATKSKLWPVWKTTKPGSSALNPQVLHDLCVAEENTQQVLIDNGLCYGCDDGGCLPPYSIVTFARMRVYGGFAMDCATLAEAWVPHQASTERQWKQCVAHLRTVGYGSNDTGPCPQVFSGALVDKYFDTTGIVEYTSSIFVTRNTELRELYDLSSAYDRGSGNIKGAYDTQREDFVSFFTNEVIFRDMSLPVGSAIITSAAMLLHTRSPFLTLVGLVEIMLSFPLAFFVYRFVIQIEFFPFLNFIGIFVVFALGADHVFVATDKWKNARLHFPDATTEEIAAKCLPQAATAMALTTATTAIAFWATAISPVAPFKVFAIFCGFLILIDYVLDVLLFFPCLCIYDHYRSKRNCFMDIPCGKKNSLSAVLNNNNDRDDEEHRKQDKEKYDEVDHLDEADEDAPLIRRVLFKYYDAIHYVRWPLFMASIGAVCICSYYALQLELPPTSGIRILNDSVEYETAHKWRQELFLDDLRKQKGGTAFVIWGVTPADNGDHKDPDKLSSLVLDETFDPSPVDAQIYLRDFFKEFYAQDFVFREDPNSVTFNGNPTIISEFDMWLQESYANETKEGIYLDHCNGASGIPMDPDHFHSCCSSWAQHYEKVFISSEDNIVKIIHFPFFSRVRFDSSVHELETDWKLIESWMQENQQDAPEEVSKAYFSSSDFWWYETNSSMVSTAVGSAAIAIAAAAFVVFISSRSLTMTIFSVLSVGYVLCSVTAMLVFKGWTLGFLESISFAILIGLSVDFVIHFSHAYTELPGDISGHKRTKFALSHMGPSILAAGFTTLAGATIMLFCVTTFFTKFALVLFLTIIQATIGSFVVFVVLADCLGPSNPTWLWDKIKAKVCKTSEEDSEDGKDLLSPRSRSRTVSLETDARDCTSEITYQREIEC